ncbi:MAG: LytTR family transcriptional regulator [Lachnospiraceae bacterium]|nr:LytTR family transcriptional regulator [Lachnospiraceae bacterium]
MKIKIEIDENLTEEEIVIRGSSLTEEMTAVQKAVAEVLARKQTLTFYKNETEFYIPLEDILFFETDGGGISAHTASDVYTVKYKLYELEKVLPRNFIRVSKSTILNVSKIYSVERNLTASSVVEFAGSHKQVYVSRYYFKSLKISLEEKRLK